MEIFAELVTGDKIPMTLTITDTVTTVKDRLVNETDLNPRLVQLMHSGEDLPETGSILQQTGIVAGDDIQVVPRGVTLEEALKSLKTFKSLKDLPFWVRKDKELVMSAIEIDWCCLQYASPEIRDDETVVSVAVDRFGAALQYAGPSVLNDKSFIVSVMTRCGDALRFVPETLLSDPDVWKAAVQHDSIALRHVPKLLQKQAKKYAVELGRAVR